MKKKIQIHLNGTQLTRTDKTIYRIHVWVDRLKVDYLLIRGEWMLCYDSPVLKVTVRSIFVLIMRTSERALCHESKTSFPKKTEP